MKKTIHPEKLLLMFLFLLFFISEFFAQTERETRAVWVATNFRLDWPPQTLDQQKQKQALIEILDNIKLKNLNTVYFQVSSNGTALFKSSFEPFSSYITGEVGGTASYDPLQFAVEQAYLRGLEIHAWINVVSCFSGTELNVLKNPNHISNRKPEWIVKDNRDGQKSLWLDPGLPEVREYLSDMIKEIVEKYDVDGIHLDYIRYPGKNFEDDFSYSVHGSGLTRDEYRRKNISDLIELINTKIKAVKHYVKLGAAPIGIYKNQKGMNGWEGYTELYQDSRDWLKRGIVDYVAPQIYWGLNDNPHFDFLAKEWVENSFGRNIVLGIGSYKPNVKSEMDTLIRYARSINANGVAFFRYENIKNFDFTSFPFKAYPASMAWLDGSPAMNFPNPPANLRFRNNETNQNWFGLSWDKTNSATQSDSVYYYALYSLPDKNSKLLPDYLFDIIPADRTTVTIAIDKPKRVNYFFTLKSVSKLWNESAVSSNVIEIKYPMLISLSQVDDLLTKPVLMKYAEGKSNIFLFAKEREEIEVVGNRDKSDEVILTENLLPGKNVLSLNKNLSDYQSLKIIYKSSNKEVELKL